MNEIAMGFGNWIEMSVIDPARRCSKGIAQWALLHEEGRFERAGVSLG
jgi:hypothetical protein